MEVMIPAIRSAVRLSGANTAKEAVWTEIVTEKIRKQKELLESLGKEEAELLRFLFDRRYVGMTRANREGHAAKVYFNALFGLAFHTERADNA